MRTAVAGLIVLAVGLMGCAGKSAEGSSSPIVPTWTAPPTYTPQPTYTQYPSPTTEPTKTPVPTQTRSAFSRWTCEDVVDVFVGAGLECSGVFTMQPSDYGIAPLVAERGLRFLIPSICEDCGGRIMSFADAASLSRMAEHYNALGKASAMFFSWVFVRENVLVQINGSLAEERAREYEAALNRLR